MMERTNKKDAEKHDPFVRRAWYGLLGVVVLLLGMFLYVNVTMYMRIRRINACGGVVLSWSPTTAAPVVHWFGYRAVNFYENVYVLRDQYQVFYGNSENSVGCGTGLSFWSGPEQPAECGDEGLRLAKELPIINRLSLINSAVTDDGLRHVAGMKSLRSLDLEGTQVEGPGLVFLKGLPLVSLSLRGTPLRNAGLVFLSDLPEIDTLDLSDTQIDGSGLSNLTRFPRLKGLDLSGTRVTDEFVRNLRDLPIESLNLYNTAVTEAAIEHLEAMTALQYVHLCRTGISVEAARRSKSDAVRGWVGLSDVLCRHTAAGP